MRTSGTTTEPLLLAVWLLDDELAVSDAAETADVELALAVEESLSVETPDVLPPLLLDEIADDDDATLLADEDDAPVDDDDGLAPAEDDGGCPEEDVPAAWLLDDPSPETPEDEQAARQIATTAAANTGG